MLRKRHIYTTFTTAHTSWLQIDWFLSSSFFLVQNNNKWNTRWMRDYPLTGKWWLMQCSCAIFIIHIRIRLIAVTLSFPFSLYVPSIFRLDVCTPFGPIHFLFHVVFTHHSVFSIHISRFVFCLALLRSLFFLPYRTNKKNRNLINQVCRKKLDYSYSIHMSYQIESYYRKLVIFWLFLLLLGNAIRCYCFYFNEYSASYI